MDQDHFKDDGTRASGSVKEAIGQVTGNAATQTEGAAPALAGQVQKAVGSASNEARTALTSDE